MVIARADTTRPAANERGSASPGTRSLRPDSWAAASATIEAANHAHISQPKAVTAMSSTVPSSGRKRVSQPSLG